MSAQVPVSGNLRTILARPATTSATTVLTADGSRPVVVEMIVSNGTASAATALVEIVRGGVAYPIIPATSLAANSGTRLGDLLLVLKEGDTMRLTSGTASAISLAMTVVERTGANA